MEAYITLLTNNNYASGALVLGHSLRASQTTKQLAILITPSVSRVIRDQLATVFDSVIEIGEIDSFSTKNLQLLGRPELGITLTKIHVFNQTQYSKVVFLDADTLVLRNIDELFDFAAQGTLDDKDRNKRFAAAPDAGWPDCFNSGVFVCRPSHEDYTGLIEMANQDGTFDGGDQGLLNSYFNGWSRGDSSNRLPFIYNTTPTSVYSYAPAFQQYKDKLAVIHFIGSFKPWQWLRFADGTVFPRNTSSTDSIALVQKWWNVFDQFIGGKPSDIHEVTHGYDLPPRSQWDYVGIDGQPQEPEIEKKPHYDGWFLPYDHQGQARQHPAIVHVEQHRHGQDYHHEHPHHHHEDHHHEQQHHHHHVDQRHEQHPEEHHHATGENQEHVQVQEYKHEEHWRPPIPPRLADRIDGHHHHIRHDHGQVHHHQSQDAQRLSHEHQHHHHQYPNQQHQHQHQDQHESHKHREHHEHHHQHHQNQEHHEYHEHRHHSEPQQTHNPHHLTDYHYHPPPPPPKIPQLPEPESHHPELNMGVIDQDERQTRHQYSSSERTSVDHEINPHHLTDYRFRLPPPIGPPDVAASIEEFAAIIPEPVGLPDMYYPNAWDLPEDPRTQHPPLTPVPLLIEDTTNDDNTSVPSGKGKPVFPWESSGTSTPNVSPRTPTRTYYNFAATAEERKRQKELEIARRLEFEEEALEQIRLQEHARYERERKRQEAQERMTGGQAFENFRLVNAWDVDIGVQMSILQKTEKRRPRSRKSSASGIRKGYGLEDMYAYEARRRQEQYEEELIRKRFEEEERWQKEQEEARIKEEELRVEKERLVKLARLRAQQELLKRQEESSPYVFRNAWDPPHMALTKKKLRIEDEEVELALPLRQNRRSQIELRPSSGAGATDDGSVRIRTAGAGRGRSASHKASVHTGCSQETTSVVSEDIKSGTVIQEARSREENSKQSSNVSKRQLAATAGIMGVTSTTAASERTAQHSASNTSECGSSSTTTENGATTSTATKMTTPGSHRFVRTTVTTTIIRRKIENGKVVSSTENTSSTGGETMFEIPAGPRSGSYFANKGRRVVTVNNSQETSRLATSRTSSSASAATTANIQRTVTTGQTTGSKSTVSESSTMTLGSQQITRADMPPGLHKIDQKTATTTTTTAFTNVGGQVSKSETISPEVASSESTTNVPVDPKQLGGMALHIDTKSLVLDRDNEEEAAKDEEERQRRMDIREKEASAAAVAEAMEVLSKYPQATGRYATRQTANSSSSSSKVSVHDTLYATDPNMPKEPRQVSTSTASTTVNKGKRLEAKAVLAGESRDEDEILYQEEDLDELEYFNERHTRTALPLGSPYMPSTPLASSSSPYRYAYSTSGYSSRAGSRPASRAGSRPTTPGPSTPSRFGPGTPKAIPKRPFELKQSAFQGSSTQPERQQTGEVDTGFSNYRIEWNLKELYGKRPRHWSAEEGEEYYDPYNALSTHGSMIDSDEDDGRMLESSSSDEDSEEEQRLGQSRSKFGPEGNSNGTQAGGQSSSSSPGYAAGENNDFTRESEFVIRGGKIARRRSSMALDRREL
ncbi:Glycogenin-2 [Haplosporangium sp. Z 11]|nr:Glycogenin-2 [Haplosporangium sp. Z 11]